MWKPVVPHYHVVGTLLLITVICWAMVHCINEIQESTNSVITQQHVIQSIEHISMVLQLQFRNTLSEVEQSISVSKWQVSPHIRFLELVSVENTVPHKF